MAISKRLRFEILRRDNHRCHYCGRGTDTVTLEVDHVVPVALGGTDDPTNLVAACEDCNSGKTSTPADAELVADVSSEAQLYAKAREMAIAQIDQIKVEQSEMAWEWRATWAGWSHNGEMVPLPDNWEAAIIRQLRLGLTIDDLTDAVAIAMRRNGIPLNDRFNYFMGVCKNMVQEIDDLTETIYKTIRQNPEVDE